VIFFIVYHDSVMKFLLQVFLHKSSFQMGKNMKRMFFVFCFDSFGLQIALKDSLFLLGVQFNVLAI
jgi:hypothetical protein